MRIGPEPTTDKFIVIMNGEEDSIVPGNSHLKWQNLNLFAFPRTSRAYFLLVSIIDAELSFPVIK